MVFAVVGAPFLVAVFTDQGTVYQYTEAPRGFFGRLFGMSSPRYRFEELDGYLLTSESRQTLLAIYFGQGAAK